MNGKQRYITYISWALTIAAYIYIGYKIYTYDDWSSLSAHLDSADAIAYICGIVALGLMPVNMLMEAWRWEYLVGGISIREAQRQVYFSKIAGQLTPYQLGEYPARGLLMKQTKWSELLSLGAVGSMTMTLAIAIVGVVRDFHHNHPCGGSSYPSLAASIAPMGGYKLHRAVCLTRTEYIALSVLVRSVGTGVALVQLAYYYRMAHSHPYVLSADYAFSVDLYRRSGRTRRCVPVGVWNHGSHPCRSAIMGYKQPIADVNWHFCKEKRKIIWHFGKKSVPL